MAALGSPESSPANYCKLFETAIACDVHLAAPPTPGFAHRCGDGRAALRFREGAGFAESTVPCNGSFDAINQCDSEYERLGVDLDVHQMTLNETLKVLHAFGDVRDAFPPNSTLCRRADSQQVAWRE